MIDNSTTILPTAQAVKVIGVIRKNDPTLSWVTREYPQLAAWQSLAVQWMKGETRGIHHRLTALIVF